MNRFLIQQKITIPCIKVAQGIPSTNSYNPSTPEHVSQLISRIEESDCVLTDDKVHGQLRSRQFDEVRG